MTTGTIRMDSPALGGATTYSIILPDPVKTGPGPYPVLLQLHGMHDDHTAWLEKSRIWVYVERLPLIVVMPSGGNFWWSNLEVDTGAGVGIRGMSLNYEDFLVDQLREHIEGNFPVRRGQPWAVGGLSMGGYGAVKLGLKYPKLFCSVYAHSSPFLTASELAHEMSLLTPEARAGMDVYSLAARRTAADLPRFSFDCGLQDHLIQHNRRFHAHLQSLGLPHGYAEYPGGHTWYYWDDHIGQALAQHSEVLGIAPLPETPPPGVEE